MVERLQLDAAVVLQRAHRRDDDRRARLQAGLAALDVDELLGAEVRAETGLGHDVVGELQRALRRDHGVAAVRDVRERTAVQEGRIVLERLHEVGLEGVLEEHRHRTVGLEIARADRRLVARVADHDVAEPLLEIRQRRREAEDRHHLGRDDDVETVLAGEAVRGAAECHDRVAQRAVVHVEHPLPRDAARVDAQLVAVVDVVVDQRGEQVVRELDRVEVAGEVEVDVLHRDDLRVTAAGRTALDPEDRAERRFAQADERLLPDAVQRVAEPDGRRRLALARRRRADRRHQDQLAVRAVLQRGQVVQRDLRLVVAVGLEVFVGDAETLLGEGDDALERRTLRDVDV